MATGAFQSSAFQSSGFQTGAATASEARSGDVYRHYPKGRDPEDVYKERVRLGIVPAPVQKIVSKIAQRVIRRAADSIDPIDLLRQENERYQRQLAAMLKEQQIAYEQSYMALLSLQIAIAVQDREDAQVIRLLMDF